MQQSTGTLLPAIIIPNTLSGVDWTDASNILYPDATYAVAGGSTQILTVGYVGKINVPVGASVDNITVSVKGYRGSYNTTLQIYAIDSSSGVPVSYPMSPAFQGFNGTNTLYVLSATLFGNTWSVNAVNNLSLKLVADGELHLDTVEVNVLYTPAAVPPTTTPLEYNTLAGGTFSVGNTITGVTSGATGTVATDDGVSAMTLSSVVGTFQIGETIGNGLGVTAVVANPIGLLVCDEFVQALPFQLAQSITSTSLFMLLSSFNYPDGVTPIQMADFHGEAVGVLDQGIVGKEETVRIVDVQQNYNGTGFCYISFGTLANRGLGFDYPYTAVTANRQDHDGTAEFVLSNPAAFYDRFVKKCQADALFSKPIEVEDEGSSLTTSLHKINFTGTGVTSTLTALHEVEVNIPANTLENDDEGTPVDTAVVIQNFVGAGVTVTQTAPGEVEVNIPGGGSSISLETNGTPNGDQTLLNLIAGTNMTITDDGVGGITFDSTGGGSGGTSSSGSSWQSPDSPNSANVSSVAEAVDDVSTYTVPSGKRLYITSVFNIGRGILVDGIPVLGNSFQIAGQDSNGLGNPIIVEAGSVVSGTSAMANGAVIIGYLIDAPISTITPITQLIDAIGGDYTVPSGKIFVLLNSYLPSGDNLLFTPNGGVQQIFGDSPNEAAYWAIEQPSFFYEGDVLETSANNGGINGYEVAVGVQFGGGGGGGGEIVTMTAAQDLTAGDPVGISNGVGGSVALAGFDYKEFSASLGDDYVLADTPVVVDTNTIVCLMVSQSDQSRWVVAGLLDPDTFTISFGTPVQFGTNVSNSDGAITALTTNKFLAVMQTTADVEAVVGTVSGTVITLGTVQAVGLASYAALNTSISVRAGSATTAMFAAVNETATDSMVGVGITISGTVMTFGSSTTLDTSASGYSAGRTRAMATIDTDKYAIGYVNLAASSNYVSIVTQSGTTLTPGTPAAVGTSGSGAIYRMESHVTDEFISNTAGGTTEAWYATVSGTTPTFGSALATFDPSFYFNGTDYIFKQVGGAFGFNKVSVSGTTLTYSTDPKFYIGNFSNPIFINGYLFTLNLLSPSLDRLWFSGMSNFFVGIATQTVAAGASVLVQIGGEATINQQVAAGGVYYVKDGLFVLETTASLNVYQEWSVVKGSAINKIII